MTVQELIDQLILIQDKTQKVVDWYDEEIDEVYELNGVVNIQPFTED